MSACKDPTERMLRKLKATIVSNDAGMLTVQVIPGMPHATVQMPASRLQDWLIKRLESRATHKGYGIGIHSHKYRDW